MFFFKELTGKILITFAVRPRNLWIFVIFVLNKINWLLECEPENSCKIRYYIFLIYYLYTTYILLFSHKRNFK